MKIHGRQQLRGIALSSILLLLAGVGLLAGCGSREEAPGALVMGQADYEKWEIGLVEMRIEKNEEFSDAEQTPLPVDKLAGFEGLNYYFPEASLRFRTPLIAAAGTDTVRLTKRRGQVVPYLRKGTVRFAHQGATHALAVFGPADTAHGDYLWLPFFDTTSGRDTYPGGRYLDVTVDADGMVDLDFNYAYNPLCDYNPDRYNCTLPPQENSLGFAVEAGEKTFGTAH